MVLLDRISVLIDTSTLVVDVGAGIRDSTARLSVVGESLGKF